MPSGTGLDKFQKQFPERFFDVGIAEQHAVTFAAGLSTESIKPFVAIYSTFLQRAYDQIIHDVAIQNLPSYLRRVKKKELITLYIHFLKYLNRDEC